MLFMKMDLDQILSLKNPVVISKKIQFSSDLKKRIIFKNWVF